MSAKTKQLRQTLDTTQIFTIQQQHNNYCLLKWTWAEFPQAEKMCANSLNIDFQNNIIVKFIFLQTSDIKIKESFNKKTLEYFWDKSQKWGNSSISTASKNVGGFFVNKNVFSMKLETQCRHFFQAFCSIFFSQM